MKRTWWSYLRWPAVVLVLGIVLLWVLPAPIEPAAYEPPPAPEWVGPLSPNEDLRKAVVLAADEVHGPEDVDVDSQGKIYAGTSDGRIVQLELDILDRPTVSTLASTGGRPLGLAFDAKGHLVVADGMEGLLRMDPEGEIEVLSTGVGEIPFGFTDDLDVARDGKIYFSDASSKFGVGEYLYDLLEARPHGRLLVFDPATGETRVLLKGLYFANGIALSKNEDFVLINETYRYRIRRYWLTGVRAGTSDIFIDNLPGFPDGISANRQGRFWVAFFTVRNPIVDRLHPYPWAKRLLSKLPKALWPKPKPFGLVLALDEDGKIAQSFQDPKGSRVRQVTSAQQAGNFLYLGNLDGQGVARFELPETATTGGKTSPSPRSSEVESTAAESNTVDP